jgi:XTP/dITP diphosphohydrolase
MKKDRSIVIATRNRGKIREIKHVLKPLRLKVKSLLNMPGIPVTRENGKTFKENAIKKARSIAKITKSLVLADDSGLEVEALNGRPGVRSARYAGSDPTTMKLCSKLLMEMRNKKDRRAKFECVIAISRLNKEIIVKGICKGRIALEMKGKHGFGYDPVFIPDKYSKTFAQMPLYLKNRISHRGKALKKAKACLDRIFPS